MRKTLVLFLAVQPLIAGGRPRSLVFRGVSPDAGGHHAIHIECLPNAGCTLFAEFLCGQLLSTGHDVACFPDVFDCTTMLPRRDDEQAPRGHHFVAKTKLWPNFGDYRANAASSPNFLEPRSNTLREWSLLGRTTNILFMRDPLANMLSLRSKMFCSACGGMRARFAAADRLFEQTWLRNASGYWDAVLFAEDMADPDWLLDILAQLLGRPAVGTRPVGMASFFSRGWHKYKNKPLAANNARLGYKWAGFLPVNGSRTGRYENGGAAYRFGCGNAKRVLSAAKSFYVARTRPSTAADQALARAMAPRLAAAYATSWPRATEAARAPRAGLRPPSLRQLLAQALGPHTCHGCRKGGCPRNASAGVGTSPQLFGLAIPHRPRDLRIYYPTLAGPPIVPVQGHKASDEEPLEAAQRAQELLYAVGHTLPGLDE